MLDDDDEAAVVAEEAAAVAAAVFLPDLVDIVDGGGRSWWPLLHAVSRLRVATNVPRPSRTPRAGKRRKSTGRVRTGESSTRCRKRQRVRTSACFYSRSDTHLAAKCALLITVSAANGQSVRRRHSHITSRVSRRH